MTWARDFSCNNIRCKNYKVKIDADTENNFCESCRTQIQDLGLCISCGVEKVTGADSVLFPWLCAACEETAKHEIFSAENAQALAKRHPVQERDVPLRRQMPGPTKTLWIVIILALISIKIGTDSLVGGYVLTLLGLCVCWLFIAIILDFQKRD